MNEKTTAPYRYKSVLLVDDNEIDNFINERIINSSGFAEEVIVKNSSDAAIDYLKEQENKPDSLPGIVFLDLNMPVKDGFVFLQDFEKLDSGIKEKCKVIVLSSSISPDDINRASTNPYVLKYINKPLSEKYLEAVNV
ncbi:MAG TPA: response regulator [Bacteroidia bacterium]|nr:response regulator [Bacteroidia bacterium]